MPMQPSTVDKIKKWGKIGTAVSTALVATLGPLLLLLKDVRSTADNAQKGAETGYATLAPVVSANQQSIQKGADALLLIAEKIETIQERADRSRENYDALMQRVTRCETYIEILSHGRYDLRQAAPAAAPDPAAAVTRAAERVKDALEPKPADVARKLTKRPTREVPNSLEQAQQVYEPGCSPGSSKCEF